MIKIDVDTRKWVIPQEEKLLGVESDEKVKKLKFEVSKNEYFSSLNFTDSACYINYKNGNVIGQYGITDVVESSGKVTFTWEVSREATRYKGKTYAILCAKKVREDGTIIREWNSAMGQFNVYEGIEPSSAIIEEPEIDIISQLLAVAQQANSNALININKSEELIQTAKELLEQNDFYKGYIVGGETYSGKASNSGIKLHKVVGKTEQGTTNGYQLFDAYKMPTTSQGGVTLTNNNDGSFTISGNGNLTSQVSIAQYSLTPEEAKKIIKVGRIYVKNAIDLGIYFELQILSSVKELYIRNNQRKDITQEIYDSITQVVFIFFGTSGSSIPNITVKPMVYQDGDGTWEPFTGGKPAPNPDYAMPIENVTTSKIFSCSGNMVDLDREWIHNNTSYVKLNDRTIKATVVNKVAYPMIQYSMNNDELEFIKGKSIRILYDKKENSNPSSIFQCYYRTSTGSIYIDGSDGKISVPKDITQFSIQIVIANTNNLDDVEVGDYATFTAPRIIVGDLEDTSWRPYGFSAIETSLTLAEGDTYENGQITRTRKQVVFDGSSDEVWTVSSSPNTFYVTLSDKSTETSNEMLSNRFVKIEKTTPVASLESGQMKEDGNNPKIVYFKVDGISGVDNFKTWLSTHNLVVEYELATPTTEEFKVPTIPSYYPFTNVSTDNDLETDMQWKILADSDRSLEVEEIQARLAVLEGK